MLYLEFVVECIRFNFLFFILLYLISLWCALIISQMCIILISIHFCIHHITPNANTNSLILILPSLFFFFTSSSFHSSFSPSLLLHFSFTALFFFLFFLFSHFTHHTLHTTSPPPPSRGGGPFLPALIGAEADPRGVGVHEVGVIEKTKGEGGEGMRGRRREMRGGE